MLAVVLPKQNEQMSLVFKQLVIQRVGKGLHVVGCGVIISVYIVKEIEMGLHAGFLIELPHAAGELRGVCNPAERVGIVAGLRHGAGRQGFALHRGGGDAVIAIGEHDGDGKKDEQNEKGGKASAAVAALL